MKKYIIFALTALLFTACGEKKNDETLVLIETSAGNITVKLFNDTPHHRDNFVKLARQGVFDSIMWHRIVPNLMIQTGDPTLRPHNRPCSADTAALHYTVPQEIIFPKYYHKRGMLAAARQPDSLNAAKSSSATQWYIVTGEKYTAASLADFYQAIYLDAVTANQKQLEKKHEARLTELRKQSEEAYELLKDSILNAAETYIANHPPRRFNDAQKKAYTTEGGCPHLDGEYTIFGEVIEGMAVVDKIASTPTDARERPLREVFIRKVTVLE